MAAIRKRKAGGMAVEGDHQDMGHDSGHADDKSKDLHGFVASLNDHEKSSLKAILDGNKTGGDKIAKGQASSEEQGKISQAIGEENQENALEEREEQSPMSPGHNSDDIAKSMLDSKYTSENPPNHKPRNLGERMKMSLASKLKAKGKI